MKRVATVLLILMVAGSAWAQTGIVPDGVTGLWQFRSALYAEGPASMAATVGTDLINSFPGTPAEHNDHWWSGYTTEINYMGINISDNGMAQERSLDYMACHHGVAPNGGGQGWNTTTWEVDPNGTYYTNEYTFAIDYSQGNLAGEWEGNYYNSLFQTSTTNGNDGDLFIKGPDLANSVIGGGDIGYSTQTFDASQFHRIVWSVDAGNFMRVYVDGTLFLEAGTELDTAVPAIDGKYALDTTALLFADNSWEDAWGMVATVAVWDHALTGAEVYNLGNTLTPLTVPVPEPGTFVLLAVGALALVGIRLRKRS
jgi:hypothetical protein